MELFSFKIYKIRNKFNEFIKEFYFKWSRHDAIRRKLRFGNPNLRDVDSFSSD